MRNRFITAAVMALTVFTLAGCDSAPSKAVERSASRALADPDPWAAWQRLNAEVPESWLAENTLIFTEKRKNELELLQSTSLVLYRRALDAGRREAFLNLYDPNTPDRLVAIQSTYAPAFLKMAEAAPGGRADARLLLEAGVMVQKGRSVLRDGTAAAGLLARAWYAGEPDAATWLNRLFTDETSGMTDPYTAYLWELRCERRCRYEDKARDPKPLLVAREMRQIQALASDASVITVNGLAAEESEQ